MKNINRILITWVCLTNINAAFSQTCPCVPPIKSNCVKPCFTKKILKFDSKEIKGLFDSTNTKALSDSKSEHYKDLSKMILKYVSEKKSLDGLKLNKEDQKAFDNVLESKKLKEILEKK